MAEGYWTKTSTFDFCESNYVMSHYIAEFWNTLSSFPIAFVGLIGLYCSWKFDYPKRYWLCYFTIFLTGVGSITFHGTLWFFGQALDELSMVVSVQIIMFLLFRLGDKPGAIWSTKLVIQTMALFVLFVLFLYVYFVSKQFFFFVIVYVSMVVYMIYVAYDLSVNQAQKAHRTLLWRLFGMGVIFYAGGFLVLWVPTEIFWCQNVRFLQGHAWFHLTSSVGPYYWLLFLVSAHYEKLGQLDMKRTEQWAIIPLTSSTHKRV